MRLTNYIYLVMLFILLFCLGSSTKIVTYQGVLDRIEDNDQAVILLETSGTTLVVPKNSLPSDSQINMWFNIEFADDTYKVVSINYELTEDNERKSTHLMNKLRKTKGELR